MLIFAISIFTIKAQETETKPAPEKINYLHSIGIGAGFTTGQGLSYRYTPQKIGFQINFAPYMSNYGKETYISVGLTLIDYINKNEWCNLYAYFANSFNYNRRNVTLYQPYPIDPIEESQVTESWNTGLGIGWEFNTKKRVVFNIMGGYAQYNSFERLFFTGELALYYRFGK